MQPTLKRRRPDEASTTNSTTKLKALGVVLSAMSAATSVSAKLCQDDHVSAGQLIKDLTIAEWDYIHYALKFVHCEKQRNRYIRVSLIPFSELARLGYQRQPFDRQMVSQVFAMIGFEVQQVKQQTSRDLLCHILGWGFERCEIALTPDTIKNLTGHRPPQTVHYLARAGTNTPFRNNRKGTLPVTAGLIMTNLNDFAEAMNSAHCKDIIRLENCEIGRLFLSLTHSDWKMISLVIVRCAHHYSLGEDTNPWHISNVSTSYDKVVLRAKALSSIGFNVHIVQDPAIVDYRYAVSWDSWDRLPHFCYFPNVKIASTFKAVRQITLFESGIAPLIR